MLAQILGLDHVFNYIMNGVILAARLGWGFSKYISMRVLSADMNLAFARRLAFGPRQLAAMVIGESLRSGLL